MYQRSLPRDDPNQCIKVSDTILKETNKENICINDLYAKPIKVTVENDLYAKCSNSSADLTRFKSEETIDNELYATKTSSSKSLTEINTNSQEQELIENNLYEKVSDENKKILKTNSNEEEIENTLYSECSKVKGGSNEIIKIQEDTEYAMPEEIIEDSNFLGTLKR